jgi:hypothetical protein
MGLGFGQLAKLMKGGMGSDEIGELLGSMGLGADLAGLSPDQAAFAFQKLWESAQQPGVVLMRVELRKQDGEKISGLLVLGECSPLPCVEHKPAAEPARPEKLLPEPA